MPHRLQPYRLLLAQYKQTHHQIISTQWHHHHHHHARRPFQVRSTRIRNYSSSSTPRTGENHYTTLESDPSASAAQLKKQFYALSKRYHPDLHRDDPTASERFVRISTAWSILSAPTKRALYDRELMRTQPGAFSANASGSNGNTTPSGSHSSAAAYGGTYAGAYGARPASGLSKRRGIFRGPPASFYRNGGWGRYGEKRSSAAAEGARGGSAREDNGSTSGAGTSDSDSTAGAAGFTPGQGQSYTYYEVPHFDREEHFRRQESVEETLRRRRKQKASSERERNERDSERDTQLGRLILVTGVLAVAAVMGTMWENRSNRKQKKKKKTET